MTQQEKTYPVNELYGPVYQGEGPKIGAKTWFLRFAGCDYRCSWCDSLHAVAPNFPGWSVDHMTIPAMLARFAEVGMVTGDWITLSGGNPALFVDQEFVTRFSTYRLAMETQGSVAIRPEVSNMINSMVVSPKPPSSKMSSRQRPAVVADIVNFRLHTHGYNTALKYVAFDEVDLDWIHSFDQALRRLGTNNLVERFISVGTDTSLHNLDEVRTQILDAYSAFNDKIIKDPRFNNFRLLPQLHAIMKGNKREI